MKFFAGMIFGLHMILAAAAGPGIAAGPAGNWRAAAPMPERRTEVAVAEWNGKIYVVGGFGGSGALLEYDVSRDMWRKRAAPPLPLHHAAAAAVGGKIYVVGGYTGRWTPVDAVLAYDPARDEWERKKSMPTPRGALAAGLIGGRIHAVGGVGPDGRNSAAHEVYDPGEDRWTRPASDAAGPSGGGRGRPPLRRRGPARGELWPQSECDRGVRSRGKPLAAAGPHSHGPERNHGGGARGEDFRFRRRGPRGDFRRGGSL